MHAKTAELNKDNGPCKKSEDWIEAGNQLHDQAIFDFFVRLLPIGVLWVKQKKQYHRHCRSSQQAAH